MQTTTRIHVSVCGTPAGTMHAIEVPCHPVSEHLAVHPEVTYDPETREVISR